MEYFYHLNKWYLFLKIEGLPSIQAKNQTFLLWELCSSRWCLRIKTSRNKSSTTETTSWNYSHFWPNSCKFGRNTRNTMMPFTTCSWGCSKLKKKIGLLFNSFMTTLMKLKKISLKWVPPKCPPLHIAVVTALPIGNPKLMSITIIELPKEGISNSSETMFPLWEVGLLAMLEFPRGWEEHRKETEEDSRAVDLRFEGT